MNLKSVVSTYSLIKIISFRSTKKEKVPEEDSHPANASDPNDQMVEDKTEAGNTVVGQPVKASKGARLSKLEVDIPTETVNEINNQTDISSTESVQDKERDEARDVAPDIFPLPLVRRGDILGYIENTAKWAI